MINDLYKVLKESNDKKEELVDREGSIGFHEKEGR